MRDARITTIYEGTTAIQANDLIGCKVSRRRPCDARARRDDRNTRRADRHSDAHLKKIGEALGKGIDTLGEATDWLLANYEANPQAAAAGAVPFLKLTGTVAGAWPDGPFRFHCLRAHGRR